MTIAVIGAGQTGREFAAACAAAGFNVVLEDVMPEKLRKAAFSLGAQAASVRFADTVEDAVRDADIAVDFIPDELESKLEIWSLIDRMAPPRTILCTPSETLSITDLASCTYRPDRCVMIRGALRHGAALRLLTARETSRESAAHVAMLLRSLGYIVASEPDPDLPMLLRNMRAATL